MDSTITITPSPGLDPAVLASPRPARTARRGGFTLVEIMIGSTISAFVLAAVLSAYMFLIRSGVNLVNYNEMEQQARTALELFAEDTRQASSITWNSKDSVTLVVNSTAIVYQYDSSAKVFQRLASGTTRNLLSGVQSFEFKAYSITGAAISLSDLTAASKATKQLQVSLNAARSNQTVTRATNTVLSARFILRNKRVTT